MAKKQGIKPDLPGFFGVCGNYNLDKDFLTLNQCIPNCLPDGKMYEIFIKCFISETNLVVKIAGIGRVVNPFPDQVKHKPGIYEIQNCEILSFTYTKV